MTANIDPKVDYAFKRLFGVESNKPLLISLLNAVLGPAPGHELVDVALLNPFNPKEFTEDKLSIVDLKARDQSGRRFTVEMQMIAYRNIVKRFLYYLASSIRDQLNEAEDYSKLQRVVLVVFLCEPLFPDVPRYHLTFDLRERALGIPFTDDVEVHTIELSKFRDPSDHLTELLDRWSFFLLNAKETDMAHFPQEMLDDPVFQQAFHELKRISQDPQEREAYERRLNNLREERSRLSSAIEEGLERGRTEGRTEGRAEGRAVALRQQVRFLERLLKLPAMPPDRLEAMPVDELRTLVDDLEQRSLAAVAEDPSAP